MNNYEFLIRFIFVPLRIYGQLRTLFCVLKIIFISVFFFYICYRVDKKRDKLERKVLDSQERAFWDVHRPMVSFIF